MFLKSHQDDFFMRHNPVRSLIRTDLKTNKGVASPDAKQLLCFYSSCCRLPQETVALRTDSLRISAATLFRKAELLQLTDKEFEMLVNRWLRVFPP